MLAVCKLALYDTCTSDIHVVKKLELVLVIFLKEIAKYADTCTAAEVDLSKCKIVGCGHIQIVGNYVPL